MNPLDSLGQIVTDMQRLRQRDYVDAKSVRDIASAVRSLAEAVLAIQAQARLAAERQADNGQPPMRPLTAAERRRLDDETNANAAIRKEQG